MKKFSFLLSIISYAILFINPLQAQIKVNSIGKVGIGTTSPSRSLQVENGSSTDYNAYVRIRGWWTNEDWQDHARLEFTDRNFGIGVGHIRGQDNMYFFTYAPRSFRWMQTFNGNSSPDDWFNVMQLDPYGNLNVKFSYFTSRK